MEYYRLWRSLIKNLGVDSTSRLTNDWWIILFLLFGETMVSPSLFSTLKAIYIYMVFMGAFHAQKQQWLDKYGSK